MNNRDPKTISREYISRKELIQKGWGRMALEKYLKQPDIVQKGEAFFLRKFVWLIEQDKSKAQLKDDPLQEEFTKIVDQCPVILVHPNPHEVFDCGFQAGIAFQAMLTAGLTGTFEGQNLTEIGKEVLLHKLIHSHTNRTDLLRKLHKLGYGGREVDYYLSARLKREIFEHYPWLIAVADLPDEYFNDHQSDLERH